MAAPVRKDQELELEIESLAYGGNGVARLNGFVVFVRRGLPGDTVRARVTNVKRNHAEALAVEVIRQGPERVEAPCVHYPACGGCRFQDLAYEAQVAAKEQQVREALRRIGGLAEPPLEPILPAVEVFHYRNKLEYSFAQTPAGAALGFHKAGRWDEVLEIERCWLTTELGNAVRLAVRDWARAERLAAYDQAEHTGYLRHLVVREGRNTGQVLVQLVTAPGELSRRANRSSKRFGASPRCARSTGRSTTVRRRSRTSRPSCSGARTRSKRSSAACVSASDRTPSCRRTPRWPSGSTSSRSSTRPDGRGDRLRPVLRHRDDRADLRAGRADGLGRRGSEESVACALENSELNGIANAAFFAGEVADSLEELADRAGPPDVVVVDPPRAGLSGKALRRMARLEASRIVYVSCNPTTLAGNVKTLRDDWGYRLERVSRWTCSRIRRTSRRLRCFFTIPPERRDEADRPRG